MLDAFTAREKQVLYGMARELTNDQIAAELGIGRGTVQAHVKRVFLKLSVHDRTLAPLVAMGRLEQAVRINPRKAA